MLIVFCLGGCNLVADSKAATAKATCPGLSHWEERFSYADVLIGSDEFKKARSVLKRGLGDCDSKVRQRALKRLLQLTKDEKPVGPLQVSWRFVKAKATEPIDFVVKAVIGVITAVITAYLLLAILWPVVHLINRRKIVVRALAVSNGDGFDGQHFVAIATDIHHKTQCLQQSAAGMPGQSEGPAAARMILDSATTAATDTVAGLTSEQTGKLAAALLSFLRRPRYTCSGSVHFKGRHTHILIRLERGTRVVECWERSSQVARLIEDLKDLSFLVLRSASADIQESWI